MKLIAAQVTYFRCIEDSERFDVDQVTCLLGKNEAGKSAILQALYRLNPVEKDRAKFKEEDYPRRFLTGYRGRPDRAQANVLTTTWRLEDPDLAHVAQELCADLLTSNEIVITKGYSNATTWQISIDEHPLIRSIVTSAPRSDDERTTLSTAKSLNELIEEVAKAESSSGSVAALHSQLQNRFPDRSVATAVKTALDSRLPTMLYFNEYYKLHGTVSINAVRDKPWDSLDFGHRLFIALLDLANSTPKQIAESQHLEHLIMELEAVSAGITDEIFEFWSQNKHLGVEFRCDQARPGDPPPFNDGLQHPNQESTASSHGQL